MAVFRSLENVSLGAVGMHSCGKNLQREIKQHLHYRHDDGGEDGGVGGEEGV